MLLRRKEDYQKQITQRDLIEWFLIKQPELQLNCPFTEDRKKYYKTSLTATAEPSLPSVKRGMRRRYSSKTGRRNVELSTNKSIKL